MRRKIIMQSKPIYISDTLHNTIQLSILEKKLFLHSCLIGYIIFLKIQLRI